MCEYCGEKFYEWGTGRTYCKDCCAKRNLYHVKPTPIDTPTEPVSVPTEKKCNKCGLIKLISGFYGTDRSNPEKVMSSCKQCHNKRTMELRSCKTGSKKYLTERNKELGDRIKTLEAEIAFLLEEDK